MRSSQVINNVLMDRAERTDMYGGVGLDKSIPDAANPEASNAHWQALLEMLWACHAICASSDDPAWDR
jgi:hypothetical protein